MNLYNNWSTKDLIKQLEFLYNLIMVKDIARTIDESSYEKIATELANRGVINELNKYII